MKDVTVVCIGTNNHDLIKIAVDNTLKNTSCEKVITFSDKKIHDKAEFIKIAKIESIKDYSYFCLKCISPFIETSHILIIQYDGFPINKINWSDEFLEYDYIGAPWIGDHWNKMEERLCVGNGGFSLRSRKLLDACQDKFINLNDRISFGVNEDYLICLEYRKFLEDEYGIKFAPRNLAISFSNEYGEFFDTFGFHGLWNIPLYFSEEECLYIFSKIPITYWNKNPISYFLNNCRIKNYKELISRLKSG
jgi:hypothetical protein